MERGRGYFKRAGVQERVILAELEGLWCLHRYTRQDRYGDRQRTMLKVADYS